MTTLTDVIQIIIGEGAEPPFLHRRLEQMSKRIRAYVEGEVSAPKRTDMRAKLEAFRTAVLSVREGLTDLQFETFIKRDWVGDADSYAHFLDALAKLADRAGEQSNKFAGRAGAKLAYPTEAGEYISSHQLCVWTIMEGMKHSRNVRVVGADNADAWKAANALYRLSGGFPLGQRQPDGSERDPSGWREHIIAVREIEKENSPRGQGLRQWAGMFTAISLD